MPIRTVDMYAEEVFKKYEERAKLIEPTRSDIKEAFIARFSEKTKTRDIEVLRIFFKAKREDDLSKKIENSNPEEFRTIQNFLTKKTGTTRKKNLDVIAWLINFNPRPYNLYRKPNAGGDSGIDIEFDDDPGSEVTIIEPKPIPEKEREIENESEIEPEIKKGLKPKKWILGIICSITVFLMLFYGMNYFSDTSKTDPETESLKENKQTNTPKKCMAWAETEYILADCTDSIHSKFKTKVRAYDENLYKNLKKVNVTVLTPFFEPNTVTPRIWYLRISSGNYEYFTAAGNHPISGEFLAPITKGHIGKYISKDRKQDDSSYLNE